MQVRETLGRIFSPEKYGRLDAKALVDRFQTIIPELLQLGASVSTLESRDDGRISTNVFLFCPKANAVAVKELLYQASIRDLTDHQDIKDRMMSIGALQILAKPGNHETVSDSFQFILYRGYYLSSEDRSRLRLK